MTLEAQRLDSNDFGSNLVGSKSLPVESLGKSSVKSSVEYSANLQSNLQSNNGREKLIGSNVFPFLEK